MSHFENHNEDWDGDLIVRIFQKMMEYASLNGASEIHLRQTSDETFPILILRDKEYLAWSREPDHALSLSQGKGLVPIMQISSSIWHPLEAHLQRLMGNDKAFEMELPRKNHQKRLTYTLMLDNLPAQQSEIIVLKLKGPGKNPA